MKWTNKVGPKLLGVNLLSLLVALVGLLLLMQFLATRLILQWHQQRVELVARLVLAEYRGKLQQVAQAASLMADNLTYGQLLAEGDIATLKSLLTPLLKAAGLQVLTITDNNGVILARFHETGGVGINISANPLVRSGLEGKPASMMTQWQDSISLGASAPVYNQDRLVGVVLTGVLIDKGFVESLSPPGVEGAIFYANRLVVNSFKDLPEKAVSDLMRSQELAGDAAGASGVQRLRLGDQTYTVTYLPLGAKEKPWENLILVGVNRHELDQTLTTLKLLIFGVGLGAALVGAFLSVWLSTGMRRQIAFLIEGTRQAAQEELAGDIPVTSQDELGELAESFNAMTRALRDKTRQLQEERDRIAANADFLSMIVHDIKAPLTGLRLTIEALEDETRPPATHQKLKGIIQRSEGLLLHLHNVLYLSRFESGLLALRPEAVPPAFLVQRLLHHFSPLAQNQGITMTSALPPNLPPIRVDEPSLERVLANLLVNALEATPPGGTVTVRGALLNGGSHPEAELVVADTGRGIPPEDQQALFEKYRLHSNHSSNSGLGLYICKTLTEANQGRIWVESAPGQGASFHLVLPIATEEASA
uniref:histidine kinase n=1 Tax=Desulfobacca acetoxidans TaxID=60893 RepID=A0A7C3V6T7_9BACT